SQPPPELAIAAKRKPTKENAAVSAVRRGSPDVHAIATATAKRMISGEAVPPVEATETVASTIQNTVSSSAVRTGLADPVINVPTSDGRTAQVKASAVSPIGTPSTTPDTAARTANATQIARTAVIFAAPATVRHLKPGLPSSILTARK